MGGWKSFSYVIPRVTLRVIPRVTLRSSAKLAVRPVVIAACVVALGFTTGCGNTDAVCADTQKTLEGFAAKTQTLPPNSPVQWKQAITDVAARLDALARRADDGKLKRALRDTAASYRAAATGMDRGDTSALSAVIHDQPQRLNAA